MPNHYDFSKFNNISEIKINPIGWISDIIIEYSIEDKNGPTCFWRVKGTKHTFIIPVKRLNYLSSGDYSKHFKDVLEKFVINDYEEWRKQNFSVSWMKEYQSEYKKFIL